MNSKTILQQKTMFYTCNNSFIISTKVFFVTLNLYLGDGGFVTILKLKNINLTHVLWKSPNSPHSLDFSNRFQQVAKM